MHRLHEFLVVVSICLIWVSLGCKNNTSPMVWLAASSLQTMGRVTIQDSLVLLHSSASGVKFSFTGDSCRIDFLNQSGPDDYHFLVVELDGEYYGRYKVDGTEIMTVCVKTVDKRSLYNVKVFKATEAINGNVAVVGVSAESVDSLKETSKTRIEFIGNSITSAMGADTIIPCNTNKWYDQHNAYYSYASITARALEADYTLSSVSGSGIYRNWNSDGPTVPQVYSKQELRLEDNKLHDFTEQIPDMVTIALGTNDLSTGDGTTPRLPFDSIAFVSTYIDFAVKQVLTHYPYTKIVLLTSPMLGGEDAKLLKRCLVKVKTEVDKLAKTPVEIFTFSDLTPTGCDYHPLKPEQEQMASELIPFLKALLK